MSGAHSEEPPRRRHRGARFVLPALVLAAACALLALLAFGAIGGSNASTIDAQVAAGHNPLLPDRAQMLALLGSARQRSLASFSGKVVLLNAYASWCVDCSQEAATLVRAQRYLARHDGTVVGLTYEDAASDTQAFDRRYAITYPVLRNPSGTLTRALGIYGVPDSFVISRSGRILAVRDYPVTWRWLMSVLPRAVARHPPAS